MMPIAGSLVAGAGQAPQQNFASLLTSLMGGGSLGSNQRTVNVQSAPPPTEQASLDALMRAREMQEFGYGQNPNATWGNVIAALLNPIAGRRREQSAQGDLRKAMEAQAKAADKADQTKRGRDFADYVRQSQYDAAMQGPGEDPLAKEKARYQMLVDQGVPEQEALFYSGIGNRPSAASQVTVNTGEQGPQYERVGDQMMVPDPESPAGVRFVDIPDGETARAAEEAERARSVEARQLTGRMGQFAELMLSDDFESAVGPLDAHPFKRTFNAISGNDAYKDQRKIDRLIGREVVELGGEVLKGSQTEGEWERIAEIMPSPTDQPEVWAAWYGDAIDTIVAGRPDLAESLEPMKQAVASRYLQDGESNGQRQGRFIVETVE